MRNSALMSRCSPGHVHIIYYYSCVEYNCRLLFTFRYAFSPLLDAEDEEDTKPMLNDAFGQHKLAVVHIASI